MQRNAPYCQSSEYKEEQQTEGENDEDRCAFILVFIVRALNVIMAWLWKQTIHSINQKNESTH